ncbi:MAG: monovalent cation/H(+) antiporter subunit G [Oscillospiraceae bacterium]
MNNTLRLIIDAFLVIGAFFALAGVVGVLRMPDSYCRMQSSTNIATLGVIGIAVAAFIYAVAVEGSAVMAVKIALVALFTILTNPISSHAICKAAYKMGVRPDKKFVCDEYGRDHTND